MNTMVSVASIATAAAVAAPSIANAAPTTTLATQAEDSSPAGALARAEEIVSLLRTNFIRQGWTIDEAAAERALAFCRGYAADGSGPEDEEKAAFDFFFSHGQSLDWVFLGRHQSLICGLATHSKRANSLADAELLRLADEYIAAEQKYCDLETKADEMKGRLVSKRPCPEALRWRETDGELGLYCRLGEWWDEHLDVDPMRLKEWATHSQGRFWSPSTRSFVPSDAARDRAHEIIAAFDEWDKDRKPPRGYKKAVREAEKAAREYQHLERRIAQTRATTVEGMLAKIRCAHAYAKSDEIDGIEGGGAEEAMALSIFDDVRRLAAAAAPSIASAAAPGHASLPGLVSDGTLAALDRIRTADKLFDRCWDRYDTAKTAAAEELGVRPDQLIAWRNYSHTGGSAIERIRNELLRDGVNPSIAEQEYRDAKKRYRATVKAGKDWDKRAGVDLMSKAVDEARAEMEAARRSLATIELDSIADASAIMCLIYANVKKYNDSKLDPWEMAAFKNAGGFLEAARAKHYWPK